MFVMKKGYLKIWLKLHLNCVQIMQLDRNKLCHKIIIICYILCQHKHVCVPHGQNTIMPRT